MAAVTSILNEVSGALSNLSNQIQSNYPDGASLAEHWNWQQPGITKQDFLDRISSTIELVNSSTQIDVQDDNIVNRLNMMPSTINFVINNTIPNATGGNSYFGYLSVFAILDSIERTIRKFNKASPDWIEIQEKNLVPAQIKKRLDSINKGLKNIENQYSGISEKLKTIEEAHLAATNLPATLSGLDDAKTKFEEASALINEKNERCNQIVNESEEAKNKINFNLLKSHELDQNIDGIQSAYIRQGLGKSFADRAQNLRTSTYVLMAILAICLGLAAKISHDRISFVEKLLQTEKLDIQVLWANVALTAFGVAAPIWFAWLLTRQISQRFRLAEDYGFKASVAKAYEGYRREAEESGDFELQKRLLSIALDRVQEAPLAHIEREESASPFHDLLSRMSRKGKVAEDQPES